MDGDLRIRTRVFMITVPVSPVRRHSTSHYIRNYPNPYSFNTSTSPAFANMAFAASTALRTTLDGRRACVNRTGRDVRKAACAPQRTPQSRRARSFPQASVAGSSSKVRNMSSDELDATIKAGARPILLDAYAGTSRTSIWRVREGEKNGYRF
eukprot:IDg17463t1